jgi:hypothetical protein
MKSGSTWLGENIHERRARKELEEKMMSSGLSSLKMEDVLAWGEQQQQQLVELNQMMTDVNVKPKDGLTSKFKEKRTSSMSIVTDDLTRIGGSIGGGLDSQRSMANSLNNIQTLVGAIKSRMPGSSSSQYI